MSERRENIDMKNFEVKYDYYRAEADQRSTQSDKVQVVKTQDNKLCFSKNSVSNTEPHVTHQTAIHQLQVQPMPGSDSRLLVSCGPRKAKVALKDLSFSGFRWQAAQQIGI